MSISKKLISDISTTSIYDTPMYKAALKKEQNNIILDFNKLMSPENQTPITPLTEQEEILAKQFEQYVKKTRE